MNSNSKPKVEVSLSPKIYPYRLIQSDFDGVVTDVFRATTSICAALDYGVQAIIPVAGLDDARVYQGKGFKIACERNGSVMDFADLGNSPSDFRREDLLNTKVVFSTTNGTQMIQMLAQDAKSVSIGALVNVGAIARWLMQRQNSVVIACAGWKSLFNLEDTLFAGALASLLIHEGHYSTECDSAKAAIDLWQLAKENPKEYLSKASHRHRLKHLLSDEDFAYSTTINQSDIVPLLHEKELIPATKLSTFNHGK